MAWGFISELPISAEEYDRLNGEITQEPDGLILHTAGQGEQGWYVYDVWESQEHFQRFVESKLGPALQEVGAGAASRPEPQFFPIETLVKGPAL